MLRITTVSVALLAGMASAQLGGLSTSCSTAAAALLTGDLSSCLDTSLLAQLITQSDSASVVPAVQAYVSGSCSQAPCSSSDISAASQSVNSACASDISSGNVIAIVLSSIFDDYPDSRGLICSQYTSNSTYCLPTVLSAVQTATGQNITVSSLEALFSGSAAESFAQNLPAGAVCTDCGHALITEISRIVAKNDTSAASSVESAAASKCGTGFGDGTIPSSVTTGSAAAGSSSSGGTTSTSSSPTSTAFITGSGTSTPTRTGAANMLRPTLTVQAFAAMMGACLVAAAGGMAILV